MEEKIRLFAFLGLFFLMALWEIARPRRPLEQTRWQRWPINLGLSAANTLLARLSLGALVYQSAVIAGQSSIGLLNQWQLPRWFDVVFTLLALDFAIYLQHILFHKIPLLWRIHRVHHADLGFDATTGVRFHPAEIFISLGIKTALVFLLGADPWAVIAFEIILNGCSLFNHGNVYIPEKLDRSLRWFIITPDMHRIHHSSIPQETNSNYGFSVPWWDRLCRTYRPEPALGQLGLQIGLSRYRDAMQLKFLKLLALPFRRERAGP